MERLVVRGGHQLNGAVTISGAKNAVVAIIPAAILAEGVCVIDNLPRIEDVRALEDTLTKLGAVCELIDEGTLMVDSTNVNSYEATFDSVRKIRASYYLMGALLARFKRADVALPGGCNFGSRPINLHLKGFRALGAEVEEDSGPDRRSHGREAMTDEFQENGRQRTQHAAAGHHAAEAHGADNEPYGIEHAGHAARGHQLVELRASGLQRRRPETAHQHAFESRHEVQPFDSGHPHHQFGLRQQHGDAGEDRGAEKRHDGRKFPHDQHARRHGHQQQPRRNAESAAQRIGVKFGMRAAGMAQRQPRDDEDRQRDDERRNGRVKHIADMREDRHPTVDDASTVVSDRSEILSPK